MNTLQIQNKLENLGFIIKHTLKEGLNRVGTQEHPNTKNGWIMLKNDYVNYGSWDETIESGYFLANDERNPRQINLLHGEARQSTAIAEKQQKEALQVLANAEFKTYKKCDEHPYLRYKKSLVDSKLKVDQEGSLVIPMYNINKQIVGFQTISSTNQKKFRYGSLLKESFFPILEPGKTLEQSNLILLVEGYATGSSVFQAMQSAITGCAVIVCFSVCNIDPVAKILSGMSEIPTLCIKDNDSPGYLPVHMGFTVGNYGEDANDVHCKRGLEELTKDLQHNLRFIKVRE